MKTLPLAIIGLDSNVTKAYLDALHQHGFRPRTLIIFRLPLSGNPKILAKIIGSKATKYILRLLKYRKIRIYRKYQEMFRVSFNLDFDFWGNYRYKDKAIRFFESEAASINDERVVDIVRKAAEGTLIYSGGGIVKEPIFDLNIPILHTHPGYLPYVRGSHGVFWSLLVREKFGCTTFYMNKGIDTGDIIHRVEYELSLFPKMDVSPEIAEGLINFYLDPLIRAKTLVSVMISNPDLGAIESMEQKDDEGETFYYMQDKLRLHAVKKLLLRQSVSK